MQNINLDAFNKEMLLQWFMYHMTQEQRFQLMYEHPVIYNKAVGSEIMIVNKREIKEA